MLNAKDATMKGSHPIPLAGRGLARTLKPPFILRV
jgi:hypothetical protein